LRKKYCNTHINIHTIDSQLCRYTQEAYFLRKSDFLEIKSVKMIEIENLTFWEIVH